MLLRQCFGKLLMAWCPRLAGDKQRRAERMVADRTSRMAKIQRNPLDL